jgi:hypothetical protein
MYDASQFGQLNRLYLGFWHVQTSVGLSARTNRRFIFRALVNSL